MPAAAKAPPRTKPPEERRGELLDAAQRLFLQQGVGPTTVEQITGGAGVAKGTFYLYFKSKEHLRSALEERFGQSHLASIKSAVDKVPVTDWKQKLLTWASASVSFYLDGIKLHDVLFYEGRSPTREGLVDNIVIDYLAQVIQAGVLAKAWSVEDARSTAVFLFSGIHGVVDDAYTKEKRVNRSRLSRRLGLLCIAAVGLSVE